MKISNNLFLKLLFLSVFTFISNSIKPIDFKLGENYTYYLEDQKKFVKENLLDPEIKSKIDKFFKNIGVNFQELVDEIKPIVYEYQRIDLLDNDLGEKYKLKNSYFDKYKEYFKTKWKDIKRKLKDNGCKILKNDGRLAFALPESLGNYVFKLNSPEVLAQEYFYQENVGRILNSIKINSLNFKNIRAPKKYLYQVGQDIELNDHNYFVIEEFIKIDKNNMVLFHLLEISEEDLSYLLYAIKKSFLTDLGLGNGVDGANLVMNIDGKIVFIDTPQNEKRSISIFPYSGDCKELYLADMCLKSKNLNDQEVGQLIIDIIITAKHGLNNIYNWLGYNRWLKIFDEQDYNLSDDQKNILKIKLENNREIIKRHALESVDDIKKLIKQVKSFDPHEVLKKYSDKISLKNELKQIFNIM
ncbi:hypothetical protein KJ644_03435 [Candidatus Dependentiae bacterium]|nr:hypothetical protein [Candidatus Dependentiae bacterium]MBU4387499.1 hypothetical protein [Candidatus Dependentiae bacterium]